MLPEATGRGQHFQAQGHSFSLYRRTLSWQITYLFFSSLSNDFEKTHSSVTMTMVRGRKIRTALRTNQIAGFVTVTVTAGNSAREIVGHSFWLYGPPSRQITYIYFNLFSCEYALVTGDYSILSRNMQHLLNWGRKEYMFQYLLSTFVLDFMEFPDDRCWLKIVNEQTVSGVEIDGEF